MSMEDLFDKTTCGCQQCVKCCYQQPGSLVPGDFERIAAHLGETPEVAKKHFWASPGALVKNLSTGQVFRIGTITPRRAKGKCVFLDGNDRCTIHAVAPGGCRYFDTHMPAREAMPRAVALATAQQQDPEYQALRDTLPYAQSYRPFSW
jgi:Fe-S-cluster containining protein